MGESSTKKPLEGFIKEYTKELDRDRSKDEKILAELKREELVEEVKRLKDFIKTMEPLKKMIDDLIEFFSKPENTNIYVFFERDKFYNMFLPAVTH